MLDAVTSLFLISCHLQFLVLSHLPKVYRIKNFDYRELALIFSLLNAEQATDMHPENAGRGYARLTQGGNAENACGASIGSVMNSSGCSPVKLSRKATRL